MAWQSVVAMSYYCEDRLEGIDKIMLWTTAA